MYTYEKLKTTSYTKKHKTTKQQNLIRVRIPHKYVRYQKNNNKTTKSASSDVNYLLFEVDQRSDRDPVGDVVAGYTP